MSSKRFSAISFLFLIVPGIVLASEYTVRENKLLIILPYETGDGQGFWLAPSAVVADKDSQRTEPYSIRPMNSWQGLESGFAFDWGSASYDSPGRQNYSRAIEIIVSAPRKKNANVAQWAASQQRAILAKNNVSNDLPEKRKVYATVSYGVAKAPDELNFAFVGSMSLGGYQCDNVIIAQGNSATRNNWWMYSNVWTGKNSPHNVIQCFKDGVEKRFYIHHRSSAKRIYLSSEG